MPTRREAPGRRKAGRPFAEALERRSLLATITVDTTGDAGGADGGSTLSLRQAIEVSDGTLAISALTASQSRLVVGPLATPNTIDFAIPGAGRKIIAPDSDLPAITAPAILDGYSQPGSLPNTNGPGLADDAVLSIVLSGGNDSPLADGLVVEADDCTVRGLSIGDFAGGEHSSYDPNPNAPPPTLYGGGIQLVVRGDRDLIEGNFVGADPGSISSVGVDVAGKAATIGGTAAGSRNVIDASGQAIMGAPNTCLLVEAKASATLVEGNFIGVAPNGGSSPSDGDGIDDQGNANTIGGTAAGAGNVISGNASDGLVSGPGDLIEGNLIGTDPSGARALPNRSNGIVGARSITIGGTAAGAGNLISGNLGAGITGGGLIQGNRIGTDASGTKSLGNGSGISLDLYSSPTTIGGSTPGARNLISGNSGDGIDVDEGLTNASQNATSPALPKVVVEGNFIGTDASGSGPLANARGISLSNASGVAVGGAAAGQGNVISGNTLDGLDTSMSPFSTESPYNIYPSGDLVEGNFIGTDSTGRKPVPNLVRGIGLASLSDTIGGTAAGAGNVISGNGSDGLFIAITPGLPDGLGAGPTSSHANLIQGNRIGIDAAGADALPNGGDGIDDQGNANTIGGTASGAGNILSGNVGAGLIVSGSGDLVEGNLIGTDPGGAGAVPDGGDGIAILGGQSVTVGGTASGAANLIADNQGDGISVALGFVASSGLFGPGRFMEAGGGSGQFDRISGNSIFGNGGQGIHLLDVAASYLKQTHDPSGHPDLIPGAPGGANALQGPPAILAEQVDGGGATISGVVEGVPSSRFTVEFFDGPAADPSGRGNASGRRFLGSVGASTDASGMASFTFHVDGGSVGRYLTATATDAAGDTSGFAGDVFLAEPTTTRLVATPIPAVAGSPLTLVAAVGAASGEGTPAGTVDFTEDGRPIGSAPLDDSGVASLTILADGGSHTFAASYSGSTTDLGSSSGQIAVQATTPTPTPAPTPTPTPAPTPTPTPAPLASSTTTLIGPGSLATFGRPVVFAAVVAPTAGRVPTGRVAFGDGGILLGTAPLDASGVAVFLTDALPLGASLVVAAYLGDPADAPSLSNAVPAGVLAGVGLDGPEVTSARVSSATTVTIAFNRPLRAGPARDRDNYAILGPDGQPLPILSAAYNPATGAVTLTTRRAPASRGTSRVIVAGRRPGGIVDYRGVALDGRGDGRPGSDFAATLQPSRAVRIRPRTSIQARSSGRGPL